MKTSQKWRNAALILVLLNLLFWAWTQGDLRLLGVGPKAIEEPQRLQQQVQPDTLQLKAAAAAASS